MSTNRNGAPARSVSRAGVAGSLGDADARSDQQAPASGRLDIGVGLRAEVPKRRWGRHSYQVRRRSQQARTGLLTIISFVIITLL